MPRSLRVYIAVVVTASALALMVTTIQFGIEPAIALGDFLPTDVAVAFGLLFWLALTLAASALPVRMPRGTLVTVSVAPILAAVDLGGPAAGVWVAAIGTTEIRELRGRIPWYGTLSNHAGTVLPAAVAGTTTHYILLSGQGLVLSFVALMVGAVMFIVGNFLMTSIVVALRSGQNLRIVIAGTPEGSGPTTSRWRLSPG